MSLLRKRTVTRISELQKNYFSSEVVTAKRLVLSRPVETDFPLKKGYKDVRSSTLLDRRNTDLPWTREEHNTPKTLKTKLDQRSVLAVLYPMAKHP